jgi:type II secretory pathway pseudopilin PulG
MNPDMENERLFLKVEKLEKRVEELENTIADLQRKYRLAPPPPIPTTFRGGSTLNSERVSGQGNLFSKYNQPDNYYYSERN